MLARQIVSANPSLGSAIPDLDSRLYSTVQVAKSSVRSSELGESLAFLSRDLQERQVLLLYLYPGANIKHGKPRGPPRPLISFFLQWTGFCQLWANCLLQTRMSVLCVLWILTHSMGQSLLSWNIQMYNVINKLLSLRSFKTALNWCAYGSGSSVVTNSFLVPCKMFFQMQSILQTVILGDTEIKGCRWWCCRRF